MRAATVPRILYLCRHGETDWNAAGRLQGHTDVPLNDTGRAQARAMAARLGGAGVGAVVASDLARARNTAEIVAAHLGIAVAYVDAGLRERAFGVFEGLTIAECAERHPDAWSAWMQGRRAPEGAESQEALASRVAAAIARAAREVAPAHAPVLVVTHGGALRAVVSSATAVANGAIWRVEWDARVVAAEPLALSPAPRTC